MNISIITSFLIAGLMFLSIIAFNQSLTRQSQEATFTTINQHKVDNLVDILSNDFNRIGFNSGTTNNFSIIEDDHVRFIADTFDEDTFGPTNVTWEFTNTPVTSTTNPNDFYLVRTGPTSNSEILETRFHVTYFELNYFAGDGSVTTNTVNVKSIQVEIIMESMEPHAQTTNGTDQYHRTVWKRTFVPNNINLPF